MKKIYLSLLCILGAVTINAQTWNISDAEFNALGSLTDEVTVSGLTIYADADKGVTIDANGKSIDDYEFTHRLKLGGSSRWTDGAPSARILSFDVDGPKKITIYGMSSSSDNQRELVVSYGDKDTELGRLINDGNAIGKVVLDYTGGATTFYAFSAANGFNVYAVIVESATAINDDIKADKQVASTQYYSINGVMVSTSFAALPKGIYIKKETYTDGTSSSTKISKTTAW
nr:hypothetical protein [uncultured Carboxylicivirga sp.]